MSRTIRIYFIIFLAALTLLSTNFVGAQSRNTKPLFTDIIITTSDTHLLLFAELQNGVSDQMIEGLHSGIPIRFSFFVELEKLRSMWFNRQLTSHQFYHTLRYDTLKEIYIIEADEQNRDQYIIETLSEAIALFSEINGMKVTELSGLEAEGTYRLRLKATMDETTLPLSLHNVLPFMSWWDLDTPWHSIEFRY
ncbi:MAG: DUF4390 domain-containing protein [Desulfofustis sp. PB-SRB1]|jgi:hypothetical protein|nr:DUF4390 domain-containing protein [Desulfofustis sp. PB-SRB1]MBM1001275.1 DUF4390 domain-containing protein [Desulfofustis sp. PB-SRB1]HBH29180.1 DUF4390 domain-containing protein [Desulfofustis sp.]HBH31580.1 DUF4390 domain-containing protein [Desulfofustis sp.]